MKLLRSSFPFSQPRYETIHRGVSDVVRISISPLTDVCPIFLSSFFSYRWKQSFLLTFCMKRPNTVVDLCITSQSDAGMPNPIECGWKLWEMFLTRTTCSRLLIENLPVVAAAWASFLVVWITNGSSSHFMNGVMY